MSALLIAAMMGLLGPSVATAQRREQKPGPHIEFVFPPGGQRGTTVEAIVGGQNLQGANAVRVNGKGVTARVIPPVEPKPEEPAPKPADAKGKAGDAKSKPPASKVKPPAPKAKPPAPKVAEGKTAKIVLTIAPDAPLGERDIRLMTPGGVSNRFRFLVGQLPEIKEVEPNSEKAQAQMLPSLPVVLSGQVLQGDRDYYRFSAKAGQTLVFQVDARRVLPFIADAVPGWNDVCLTLYDAKGKRLASVDDFRFKPDPVLVYEVRQDGEYIIGAEDILFRGREDFIYRLSIGTLPFISHVYPIGAKRGSTAKVELAGVNLPSKSLTFQVPGDSPAVRSIEVSQNGITSNAMPFAVGDLAETDEKEPNGTAAQANRVEVPVTINGRIQSGDDEDYFVFAAKAGERLIMEVQARRLDSPLDSILTLLNAKEQELAENDDTVDAGEGLLTHHADSRLVYAIPATGDYLLRIRDVQGKGGPEYAYRLSIAPVRPDFALRTSPDNPIMGPGDTTMITVSAVRKDGFVGEIVLAVQDLPKGFVASEAVIPAGGQDPTRDQARLTITSPPGAASGQFSPTVVGTATIDNQTVVRKAVPAETMMQAFSFTHNVPTQELLLSVMGTPPPFALSVDLPPGKVVEIPQGGETQVAVKAVRNGEAKGAIFLALAVPVQGIQLKTASIPADKSEAALTIMAQKFARPGVQQNLILQGTMRAGKENPVRMAPALAVKVLPEPKERPKPPGK